MDQQQSAAADVVDGRLMYLVENLASLHAASGEAWIAGRFEFLGEKALGAALSVLALPDESGAYRSGRERLAPSGCCARPVRGASHRRPGEQLLGRGCLRRGGRPRPCRAMP